MADVDASFLPIVYDILRRYLICLHLDVILFLWNSCDLEFR